MLVKLHFFVAYSACAHADVLRPHGQDDDEDHCTAMGWTPGATVENAGIASTTNDNKLLTDYRLIFVPGKRYDKGAMRPIYRSSFSDMATGARLVAPDRSPEYAPTPDHPHVTKPIGHIPQVGETLSYYDGAYGLQNDYISIGESTCSAKLYAWPLGSANGKGTALVNIAELSRIALERCKTASCAVDTIGTIAEEYGFFGKQQVKFAGEALIITDGKETWIWHGLADPTGKSAIWAAQRIPEGEMAVVANMFIIRKIDLADHTNFRASKGIVEVADKLGWYDPKVDGPKLDFVKAFSAGEYNSPYYSARRAWRIMSRVAPSLKLDPVVGYDVSAETYPVFVKPDRPWSIREIFDLYRDYYEGTPYDMTKGLMAGPFGNPERLSMLTGDTNLTYGAWERPLPFHTVYTSFGMTRMSNATGKTDQVLWFGPGIIGSTLLVPMRIAAATKSAPSLLHGTMLQVSPISLWWAVQVIHGWATRTYSMAHIDIRKFQNEVESDLVRFALSDGFYTATEDEVHNRIAKTVRKAWEFLNILIVKYLSHGFVIEAGEKKKLKYPIDYIHKIGEYEQFSASKEQFDLLFRRMINLQKVADEIVDGRVVGAKQAL